jgi:hypothetical protein
MYPTTIDYRNAIRSSSRTTKITGLITLSDESTIEITNDIIAQGSLYISEQSVSGDDLDIGSVYLSEMGIGLITDIENPYTLDGARINLQFGILLADGITWEYVELGTFYVYSIERGAQIVSLKAYDGLILFDIAVAEMSGNPYNLIHNACGMAGVPLGMAQTDFEEFANYDAEYTIVLGDKIKTCRDLIMWVCQLLGAFARTSRIGELEIVKHGGNGSTVRTIATEEQLPSPKISDFEVQITEVTMKIGDTDYTQGTAGMTMALTPSPLLTDKTESEINTALAAILTQIGTVKYIPFNMDITGDPSIQPGDYVLLEGTTGGDTASLVTHSTWRYRGKHTIRAAGKNAILRSEYSQVQKAIEAVSNTANEAHSIATVAQLGTELLNSAIGGNILVRQESEGRNEILIMDNIDPDEAIRIWRYNINGWGYSNNCVGADNPEREYTVKATMDGALYATQVIAAVGTFIHLIAGDPEGARSEQGVDESGNPYLTYYDNDGNEKISVVKEGVLFDESTRLTGYTTRTGKRSGVAIFIN